jgi:hypothetical protein
MDTLPLLPDSGQRLVGIARLAAHGESVRQGHDVEYFTLPVRSLLNRCSGRRRPVRTCPPRGPSIPKALQDGPPMALSVGATNEDGLLPVAGFKGTHVMAHVRVQNQDSPRRQLVVAFVRLNHQPPFQNVNRH